MSNSLLLELFWVCGMCSSISGSYTLASPNIVKCPLRGGKLLLGKNHWSRGIYRNLGKVLRKIRRKGKM
jgi:hypothetical protein